MKLGKKISIDSIEYASQGNAILGIRNSGKSYTATFIAERLMDDNIPFIAFDPIGIWKYLKVGANGKKGYPVVVAGDGGDLPLTPASSVDIVRAAMKENVSLVLDLYSMSLSKADWRQIVEKCIRLLLYENKSYGLRHIFIEEAAEFCPQRVPPEQGKVYAEIEKLARMGGNASLGYTLINQRAEEVNKAVLELCDCLFLHRQKGRHSLTALGKWLDVADTSNSKEIINSLPSLEQGECWVWLQGSHAPVKILVPEKTTVHPDRKNPLKLTSGIAVDVSKFVDRMNKSLATPIVIAEVKANTKESAAALTDLKKQYDAVIRDRDKSIKALQECVRELQKQLARIHQLSEVVKEVSAPGLPIPIIIPQQNNGTTAIKIAQISGNGSSLAGGPHKMLRVLAMLSGEPISKERLSMLSGYSITSSTFGIYINKLKELGYAQSSGNDISITTEGLKAVGEFERLPTNPESLISYWISKIPGGPAKMFKILTDHYPKEITRDRLSDESGYSITSSTFGIYINKLKTLKLVSESNKMLKAADELYS